LFSVRYFSPIFVCLACQCSKENTVLSSSPTTTPIRENRLTPREREIVKLLAEGKTVRAAAADLGLSSKTVDAHKFNLMKKLGIHKKAELVMWAIRERVVDSQLYLKN
jgi:DNA-binding NarL/FixJ family response regulator